MSAYAPSFCIHSSLCLKNFCSDGDGSSGFLENMPERNIRQMNRHDRIGVIACELFGDGATPVAAMCTELFVAE